MPTTTYSSSSVPRRGEGAGLRWTELDLDAAVMTVTEQIVQVGWETETSTPKADSEGLAALDSVTIEVLRAHAERQAIERQRSGEAWIDSGYVFTTEDGRPVHPDYVSRHFVRVVRQANRLRVGSRGQAVRDVQQALGLVVDGQFGAETRRAVAAFQARAEVKVNGIVDPHTWYRLLSDDPLRPYPHPGYLPPIRLHDLRHGAATLALAAGTDMKMISEMLRHSSTQITSDTYTSVLPEVAREAAEAAAGLVPRQSPLEGAVPNPFPTSPERQTAQTPDKVSAQLEEVRRQGLEPRTRWLRASCSAS
jgi:integrase